MKTALAAFALALGAGFAAAQIAVPALEARVTDLTGTLTADQQAALEEKLAAFEARKGAQVVVLIVPTTEPEDAAQFGIRVADAWKVGREKPDDGAILIVAKEDRAMRIEVGRGLEGALNDLTSARIIDDTIAPLFRQGDFYGGVNAGLDQMTRVIDGEPLPEPDHGWTRGREAGRSLPQLFLIVVPVAMLLRRLIGRLPAALLSGAGVGFFTWWATSVVMFSVAMGAFFFVLTLVIGLGGVGRGGWGGGRVFRGSGGFGGSGGFRGGGGSFGGGGASGRW